MSASLPGGRLPRVVSNRIERIGIELARSPGNPSPEPFSPPGFSLSQTDWLRNPVEHLLAQLRLLQHPRPAPQTLHGRWAVVPAAPPHPPLPGCLLDPKGTSPLSRVLPRPTRPATAFAAELFTCNLGLSFHPKSSSAACSQSVSAAPLTSA